MPNSNIFNGKRILVLEDDYLIVADLVSDLQEAGAEVVGPFASIDQALGAIEKERPLDGAILDVNVQGAQAFRVADALSERNVAFVFATGFDRSEIPSDYQDAKILQKPVHIADIIQALLH